MVIRDSWLRALVVIACIIAAIYLFELVWQIAQQFSDILLLFALAWLLAFILEPVVAALSRVGLPRILAIALTYLALLVLAAIGVVLLLPALTAQVVDVVAKLPSYVEQVTGWALEAQASVNAWLTERRSPVVIDVGLALQPDELARRAEGVGLPLLSNVVQVATGAATLLAGLALALILSIYFMLDGARLAESFITALPPRARDDARFLVAIIHRAFAGFLRGQVILSVVLGIATGIMMSALGVSYALLASVVSGVILLIPFLGPVVALWVPVTIAIFTRPEATIILLILLLLLQQVLFNVLGPRIMSRQVGLHPLIVFFAVLIGARVAGVWGALFGVPVAAVAATMLSFYRASHEERVAQLQEHLPGQELASVPPSEAEIAPVEAPTHPQPKEVPSS